MLHNSGQRCWSRAGSAGFLLRRPASAGTADPVRILPTARPVDGGRPAFVSRVQSEGGMPIDELTTALPIGLGRLSVEDVVRIARDHEKVADLAAEVEERMRPAAEWVAGTVDAIEQVARNGKQPRAFYGINTGFGALAGRSALDSK